MRVVDWDSLQMGLLFCYEGTVPEIGFGRRLNPGATAWLIRQGWGEVADESGLTVRAEAGQWLMARHGLRVQSFSSDARLLSINFRAAFHTGENLFEEGLSRILDQGDYPKLERQARSLLRTAGPLLGSRASLGGLTTPISLPNYLKLQCAVVDWVRVWCDALLNSGCVPTLGHTSDPRVAQVLVYLRGHVRDLELNGDRLASEVGLSLSQLNRLFMRHRGETLRRAHEKHRVLHAQQMLMRSTYSMKEVALDLGFRHASHFTTWFRKQTGVTPTGFRAAPISSRFFPPAPEDS
jgi:AraC-like DNA-binding protein